MKTAVSIPTATFERADLAARRLGISRSELYARALEEYLGPSTQPELTESIDRALEGVDSGLDPAFARAQQRAVGATW